MWEVQTYRPAHLQDMCRIWNQSFAGGPNFVHVTEADLRQRVIEAPSFDPTGLLVARRHGEAAGFVHFGFRANLWQNLRDRRLDTGEGHIYALVAPSADQQTMEQLLDAALERLARGGARRVLLGPSWVCGTQPFYNGIAGAYEMPGLDAGRQELVRLAGQEGFAEAARYGTPELDLSDRERIAALRAQQAELTPRAREWGLCQRIITLTSAFFSDRRAVVLARGFENVAVTAFGPWREYVRQYRRQMFGITSVQVAEPWRGKGLGKLVMLLAIEAAMAAGAEKLHLHVHEANLRAWRLYHQALGFQPTFGWVTLARDLA